MSYCRFSSDNFQSDAYIYYSVDNLYVICLAAKRVVGDIPKVEFNKHNIDVFFEAHTKQQKFLETAEREKIDLPYAGDCFYFETLEEALEKVMELIKLGYRIPKTAVLSMQEDLKEL